MSIKTYHDYLTCVDDTNHAQNVCGRCGDPVCEDHAYNQSTFSGAFSSDAWELVALILVLIIGVPILLRFGISGIIGEIRRAIIPGQVIYARAGLVQSSLLLGVFLSTRLWYRTTDGSIGYEPLVRTTTERVVCEKCHDDNRNRSPINYGLYAVAVIMVLAGLFGLISAVDLRMLRLIAIGSGIYLIKDELLTLLS